MLKPNLLREMIVRHEPFFNQNPDRLEVFVTKGNLMATGTNSASFLYQYQLEVLALDYPHPLDNLSIPILACARRHQPDLLFNPERRKDGFRFEVDLLNNDTADILFTVPVSERVMVSREDGRLIPVHLDEPVSHSPSLAAWDVLNMTTGGA
ncbi:phage tail protein [Xenorhabdus cabanillasii]|uniref:P2 phage tail completion protein R n=1 Tax=Xenorhabdus cabanillasii JM26 TaxID=1427517 RepID=W1JBG7_9GAMM|nr:phage tail protein [Xenorhabdus cabanillasii]PHM76606.1 tail protein [Xenorhabdus cabanillasii JM26]CDL87251.1 P2 phage tail completion protein R [Xenorhabdus cabanillasii JM26]